MRFRDCFRVLPLLLVSLAAALPANLNSLSTSDVLESRAAPDNGGIKAPIAAAWLYMTDSQDYNSVPDTWNTIDFSLVDVLYVAPFGLQADGTFGLYNSQKTGPLNHRFEWVLQKARSQNKNIKVLASQFYGGKLGKSTTYGYDWSSLKDDAAIKKYTSSVADFVKKSQNTNGGIDGFDVDFESSNVIASAAKILSQIRSKLDALGGKYYITVSPSVTDYLKEAKDSIDFVNMQNYAGGYGLEVESFTAIGFKSTQLLFGICPEAACQTRPIDYVKNQVKTKKLAGVHLWRLDSSNYKHELDWQKQIFNFLH